MKEKMSRWGVGPVFASLSIGYGIVVLAVGRYFHPVFQIPLIPRWVLIGLGVTLITLGLPFFIRSLRTMTKAYNADSLVTHGVYRCCRHPVYSAWVVFIVPGIVLLTNSWLGLTAPVFMYVLLCKLVTKEETYLEGVFGDAYKTYRKKTPCILPLGFFKKDQQHG